MGGGAWICSGAVATDSRTDYSLVLTAGHCAVDADTGEFATNWMFIPAFDLNPTYTCASTTFGCWTATALVVRREFASAGGFNSTAIQHDWAFAVVAGGGKEPAPASSWTDGRVVRARRHLRRGQHAHRARLPGRREVHGSDLVYCQGRSARTLGRQRDVPDGLQHDGRQLGGPWLLDAKAGYGAKLKSLNSYGYSGIKNMYGPIFNAETAATYTAADDATW